LLKEPAGRHGVPAGRDEHVDDLAELADRSVEVPPPPGDLDVGLVDVPAIADAVAAWSRGVGQQWREPQYPSVDGDVVDLAAALGEEFYDVAVGQTEARGYQRTATTITSGGKRKPAKMERGGIDWRDGRVVLMVGVSLPGHLTANATVSLQYCREKVRRRTAQWFR
jgi:hypothetical protein